MKVAIIEPVGGHGGLEIYDLGVCCALADAGCDVTLYTCDKTGGSFRGNKCKINRYFWGMFDSKKGKFLRFFFFIRGMIHTFISLKKSTPEIIYLHTFTFSLVEVIVLLTTLLLPVRIFVNIHDPITYDKKSKSRLIPLFRRLLRSDKVTVTTHTRYSKQVLTNLFPELPIVLMPHSDIDELYDTPASKEESKQRLGLEQNVRYVLFFGQIKSAKGLETLLKSWSDASKISTDLKLLIIGRCWRNDCDAYKQIINDENISANVIWREIYVEDAEVPYYFRAAEVVVLPYTRIYSSGVLLRAIGYGTPVIVSDQPAFTEIVEDNKSALVFRTGVPVDLADKLKIALGPESMLGELSRNAKTLIQNKHSWEFVGKEMSNIFRMAAIER